MWNKYLKITSDIFGKQKDKQESSFHLCKYLKYISLNNFKKFDCYRVVNNADWYEKINAIQYMRIARHFRMGSLMARTSIRERLNSPRGISCAEFMYQIFQSYDWLYLLDKYDCKFQVGFAVLGNSHAFKKIDTTILWKTSQIYLSRFIDSLFSPSIIVLLVQ